MTLKDEITNTVDDAKVTMAMNAPPGLSKWFHAIMRSEKTPWFFLGMAVEALGITVQFQIQGASYPIMDFLLGAGIWMLVLYYQRDQIKKVEPEEVEEDDDADETET